jgi:hypothetical protein
MAPFYEYVCQQLGWVIDNDLLLSMKAINTQEVARLEAVVKGMKAITKS